MENASKALIMAGAILIALLIISLSVYLFNNMGDSAKKMANMDKQEIEAFNSKITPYLGESVSGSKVNSLIQYVISVDNSAVSSDDVFKSIAITYPPASGGGENKISVDTTNKKVTYSQATASRKVKTGGSSYYKVTATYSDDTGLISEIKVQVAE